MTSEPLQLTSSIKMLTLLAPGPKVAEPNGMAAQRNRESIIIFPPTEYHKLFYPRWEYFMRPKAEGNINTEGRIVRDIQ